MLRPGDGVTAGVNGCDGTRIKIAFLPPSSLIAPSWLAWSNVDIFASTNIPKPTSIPESFAFLIFSPIQSERDNDRLRWHSTCRNLVLCEVLNLKLIVENDIQKGTVDLQPVSVVVDKSQFAEAIHEKIHSRAGCAHHLGERGLTYFGKDNLRHPFFAEVSQQQKN